ncbi:hypothetical protein [Hymenobacter sp. DG01]|uniref:hypothetical protein n=1 Tax=Hymenobacter sp. DG01 TaxID=2584940 RepID=UPI0011208599|nr:hypothetical protein [Hymenobacter sp. DG01]
MKKISRILKGDKRVNSVDFLLDGAELPYAEKLGRKRQSGRTTKTTFPPSSADSEAEQPSLT